MSMRLPDITEKIYDKARELNNGASSDANAYRLAALIAAVSLSSIAEAVVYHVAKRL